VLKDYLFISYTEICETHDIQPALKVPGLARISK